MKKVLFTLLSICALLSATSVTGQGIDRIEEMFIDPPQDSKPLIIWQWMDGLVTKESITADLEAFKAAGLGGVQNFQIGHQGLIGNPDILVGSPEWKELMVWTLQECARLGLSFGTHNCPGWSSSAAPDVLPEYSMQKLVWTETPASGTSVKLSQPETNLGWYKDIEVLAVPASGIVPMGSVIDLHPPWTQTDAFHSNLSLPENGPSSDSAIPPICRPTVPLHLPQVLVWNVTSSAARPFGDSGTDTLKWFSTWPENMRALHSPGSR